MNTKTKNTTEQKIERPHHLDGFLTSHKLAKGLNYYFCGIRGYSKEAFRERWGLVKEIKKATGFDHIIHEGEYIVSVGEIADSLVEQLGITPTNDLPEKIRTKAQSNLIRNRVLNDFRLAGFHRIGYTHRYRRNSPFLSQGVFDQYLEFDPKILRIGERYILRPNPKCIYKRTDSCLDQLNDDWSPSNGCSLSYKYQPKTCIFRRISDRTLSDPMNESGKTLMQWYEEESTNRTELRKFLPLLRSNPEMPVIEVDYDYFNQGKNTRKYYVAACLLSQSITLNDIPEKFRGRFMDYSHIDMSERISRCQTFLGGLSPEASESVMYEPVSTQIASLEFLTVSEPNLEFGDGSLMLEWDPRTNYSSLLRHHPYKLPLGQKKVGFVPFEKNNSAFRNFIEETTSFLRKMGCDIVLEALEPWNLDNKGRAREFNLADDYGNSQCDALLIELKEYSDQHWVSWKRALTRTSMPSQMVTPQTFSKYGAPFNTALGLLSALGGLPYGISKSYSGVQVWIGMDTWREGRKNVAAASVSCDAGGLLMGYPNPVVTAGERTDDKAFRDQLTTTVDGVIFQYEKMNEAPPTVFGLIRDGIFFENMKVVEQIEEEYGIEFVICDVQKFGAPKLAMYDGNYKSAEPGAILWNGDRGYIQSTEQRKGRNSGTPNLISVSVKKGNVTTRDLLLDLFWLTNIHAGATQQPGYPVPQFYAHKIAQRASKGVALNQGFHTDLGIL